MSLIMLAAIFVPCVSYAQTYTAASSGISSVEVCQWPHLSQFNKSVSFTVVTDTNASKVKIQRGNGNIFTIANIENGFSDYTDSGSQRVWTITKRLQLMAADDFIISARQQLL